MVVHALAEDGTTLAAVLKLGEWFRILNEHRKDGDKHSAGEGHDHAIPSGRTEES